MKYLYYVTSSLCRRLKNELLSLQADQISRFCTERSICVLWLRNTHRGNLFPRTLGLLWNELWALEGSILINRLSGGACQGRGERELHFCICIANISALTRGDTRLATPSCTPNINAITSQTRCEDRGFFSSSGVSF